MLSPERRMMLILGSETDLEAPLSYFIAFNEIIEAYQTGGDVAGTCAAFKHAHKAVKKQMEDEKFPHSWIVIFKNFVSSRLSPILGYSTIVERQPKQ